LYPIRTPFPGFGLLRILLSVLVFHFCHQVKMQSTEETLASMRREMRPLLEIAMEGVLTKVRGVLEEAEQQRNNLLVEVAEERAKGLAEAADERHKGLAEANARRAELHREVAAMQMHQAAHEGRVELNIGGFRFETSVQTLRRIPHTFFDAYFSGRYAQDVWIGTASTLVSAAEPGARPSISLLRTLKREFRFHCIELCAEQPTQPHQPEVALVMGGHLASSILASMERYDLSSGQWSVAAAMS
jgi:hypothetical protein